MSLVRFGSDNLADRQGFPVAIVSARVERLMSEGIRIRRREPWPFDQSSVFGCLSCQHFSRLHRSPRRRTGMARGTPYGHRIERSDRCDV